jgi:hypothetical protein
MHQCHQKLFLWLIRKYLIKVLAKTQLGVSYSLPCHVAGNCPQSLPKLIAAKLLRQGLLTIGSQMAGYKNI